MMRLNVLEVLLLLSAGAFLLPALVGGRARAIAGIVIGGIAVFGLLVVAVVPAAFSVRFHGQDIQLHTEVSKTAGIGSAAGDSAQHAPEGIPLDPVQFERERAEIERQWQEAELDRRMWHTGSVAGGLFAWLALATAYLKLDLLTAGRYRNRLRLGAAATALLTTAAGAWVWTL